MEINNYPRISGDLGASEESRSVYDITGFWNYLRDIPRASCSIRLRYLLKGLFSKTPSWNCGYVSFRRHGMLIVVVSRWSIMTASTNLHACISD